MCRRGGCCGTGRLALHDMLQGAVARRRRSAARHTGAAVLSSKHAGIYPPVSGPCMHVVSFQTFVRLCLCAVEACGSIRTWSCVQDAIGWGTRRRSLRRISIRRLRGCKRGAALHALMARLQLDAVGMPSLHVKVKVLTKQTKRSIKGF